MKPNNLPRCEYCLRKMTNKYILCVPCDLEFCLKCFCYGVEGGNHRKNHTYKIQIVGRKKEKSRSICDGLNWNFEEEILFIDAVGVYKCGNWTDISMKVQSKSPEECRIHFLDQYIKGDFRHDKISNNKSLSPISQSASSSTSSSSMELKKTKQIFDHTEDTSSSPLFYEKYPPSLMNPDEEKFLGYLPRRNEFLIEYDDNAEQLICSMESDRRVKSIISAVQVALVDIYKRRLLHRGRCKRLSLEHGFPYHLMAQILEKPPRDYNYFQRQLAKRVQPCSTRRFSLSGRQYVHSRRSFNTSQSLDGSSCEPSTPSSNDLVALTPASSSATSQGFFNSQYNNFNNINNNVEGQYEQRPFWQYNISLVDERLKPFLRYLSSQETKDLLDSLKREHVLKTEIHSLQSCVAHNIKDYQDYRDKLHQHSDTPASCRPKHNKRRRGIQNCFQFVYMMRKKRMDKYLESLKHHSTQ